jgi:hypothetical protein
VEQGKAAIARQQRNKHIFAATNQHATTEELFEAMFRAVRAAAVKRGPAAIWQAVSQSVE